MPFAQISNACTGSNPGSVVARIEPVTRRCSASMSSNSARRESACQRSSRGQIDDPVAQPVDPEPVPDDAEQRGDVLDRTPLGLGEVRDVERGVQRVLERHPAGEIGRDAEILEARLLAVVPLALAADEQIGEHLGDAIDRRPQLLTRGAHRERPPAVTEEPAAGALDHLARLEVHRDLGVGGDDPVERFHAVRELGLPEHGAGGLVRAQDLVDGRTRFLAEAVGERRSGPVDHAVDEGGHDDLPAQRMVVDPRLVTVAHGGREVLVQHRREVGVLRQRGGEHVVLRRDLGVREEHGQLGRCEAESRGAPVAELLVGRERFHFTVEVARLLERADEPGVHVLHRRGLFVGVGERARLAIVVAHDEPRDLVAHGLQQRVPIVDGELAGRDDAVEEHLQVDLVVGHVDARAVVDRIRVDEAARERELDAAALGEPEVAALADDAAVQLGAVDAHGVVRLVADVARCVRCAP